LAENPQQRRAADRVPPDVLLAIDAGDTDTRHILRGEFGEALNRVSLDIHEVGKKVETGNLADVTERARMTVALETLNAATQGLREDVSNMRADHGVFKRDVEQRLRKVEDAETSSSAVREMKRWAIGAVVGVAGVMVGSVAFLAQHIH
jgi:hypothetical protein